MSMLNIFDISGSGMNAQQMRLTTTASNLSNAEVPASSEEGTYKARYPVFESLRQDMLKALQDDGSAGVKVNGIVESDAAARKIYQPGHTKADKDGYIYMPNVNPIEEMANMISASRSYEMNAQVFNTAKQLMLRTLQLGQ